ncbi:MAG: hypothetical protein BWX80_02766 [Candidatus Hydrogenedentes bacterium ADurb.Bin101]|nr:MAG: hypothetical protein BWX80_02766 [Candidatus Hydrogenedentes bacterium ADurb.Bin101]
MGTHGSKGGRRIGFPVAYGNGRLPGDFLHSLFDRGTGIGFLAGDNLIENDAKGIHIRALIDTAAVPCGLFRRHIQGRSHHRAGKRDVATTVGRALRWQHSVTIRRLKDIRPPQFPCQPPVQHNSFAVFPNHDIIRLEVAVYDPPTVGVGNGLAQIDKVGQQQKPFTQGRGCLNGFGQGLAMNHLHGVIRRIVLTASQLIDRHNGGMLQTARNPCLLKESPQQGVGAAERPGFRAACYISGF